MSRPKKIQKIEDISPREELDRGEDIQKIYLKKARKPKSFVKKLIFLIFILIIALLAFSTVYFYKKSLNTDFENKTALSDKEITKIIKRVESIVSVPKDEVPSVAMVTDPSLLSAQSFFSSAKKGDIVLVYSSIKKLILYDLKTSKVIDMASVNLNPKETPYSVQNTPAEVSTDSVQTLP